MDITFQRSTSQTKPLQLSAEMIAYICIFALALILRLVALDQVPLNEHEAGEALAALHRVDPDLNGDPVIARNPMMTFFNQFVFFTVDRGEFGARLSTAIVGALLVWGAFLWRRYLGRITAVALALLLALSPVALASARQMGGLTWTMAMVFVVGWALGQYWHAREKRYAIMTTMSLGAMLFLTDPSGPLVLLGVLVGLLGAIWQSRAARSLLELLRGWPWMEGLLATGALLTIVGTGFFTSPQGLTEVGNTFAAFIEGVAETPDNTPRAFALLIALRYDLGVLIFGLVGVYFAVREGDFVSRFFAGWFAWGLLMAVVYLGTSPDAAMWVTVPAAGLTAMIVGRLARNASTGYWIVPGWAIPVHAAITATLLAAVAVNGVKVGRALQLESRPVYFHSLESLVSDAEVGTFDQNATENTFEIYVDAPRTITVQVQRWDDTIDPVLRVESFEGQLVAGPFFYPDGERRGIVAQITFANAGTHYLKVSQNVDQQHQRGQFALLTHPEDVTEQGILGLFRGYNLDTVALKVFSESISTQALQVITVLVAVFLIMLMIIIYFLVGSLWGTRAAWRGLGFGLLTYFLVVGIGLGWQASVTFGGDVRELWQTRPTSHRIVRLTTTLEQMSRFDNGEPYQLAITAQVPDDGALAWALRNFDHVQYVDGLGIEVNTGAVIAPYDQTPLLGADYVGQDFVLTEDWSLSDLSWMDFVAWLTVRETRFDPLPDDHYMLWVRKDVYGVRDVTTQ